MPIFGNAVPERAKMTDESISTYLRGACSGRQNITPSATIEQALHISGNELRRRINRLRRKGVPIASSQHGYYYAITAGEVYTTIRQLKNMADGLAAAIHGLEDTLEHFTGGSDE
jgi:biotin operon repressor